MSSLRSILMGMALPVVTLAAAPAIAFGPSGAPGATQSTPAYPYPSPGPVSPPPRFLDPPPPAYVHPPGAPAYPQPGYSYPPGYAYPAPGYAYPWPRPMYPPRPDWRGHDWRETDRDRDGVPDRWDSRPNDPWRH